MPKATNTPGPLKAAAVVCAVVFAGGCLLLAFRCSGSALPNAAGAAEAQALAMCQLAALRPLALARQEAEALPKAEAHEVLAKAALIAAGHLRACVSPSAVTDDAGAP